MSPVNPPVVNPLRDVRLHLGWSLDRMAEEAGVSRQFIIRTEQAVYADPPPSVTSVVLNVVSEEMEDVGHWSDEGVLRAGYHAFQRHTRRANYGRLNPFHSFFSKPASVHPWVEWRMRSGITARIGPAKLYCVHPALLHKFEMQPHLLTNPPGDLMGSLRESGYSSEILGEFEQAYYRYRMNRKGL